MSYTGAGYDAETLGIMTPVFSAVWHEALGRGIPADRQEDVRAMIAAAICGAVDNGVRDPATLKRLSLQAIQPHLENSPRQPDPSQQIRQ